LVKRNFDIRRPYFVKRGTNHTTLGLEEKQDEGSVLYVTNALRVGYPPHTLMILEDRFHIFLHIIEEH